MAHVPRTGNGGSGESHVFNDLDRPDPVDQSNIKPRRSKLAFGLGAQELGCGLLDAKQLPRPEHGDRAIVAFAFLDLDENNLIGIAQNEVDFTAASTPSPRQNSEPAPFVLPLDRRLGRIARVVGKAPVQVSFSIANAI